MSVPISDFITLRPPPSAANMVPQRRASAASIKVSAKSPSTRKGKSLPPSESDTESDASLGRRKNKRSDSMGTTKASSRAGSRSRRNSAAASDKEKDTDGKEKKKDSEEKGSRRLSMAGWASSLTGRNKKDKEKFTALLNRDEQADSEDEQPAADAEIDKSPSKQRSAFSIKTSVLSSKQHKSKESLTSRSPKTNGQLVSSSSSSGTSSGPKLVRALYDFSSTSLNELSFRTGDEIVVLNEVLDEWWLGKLNDKEGLFPTTYTEIISKPPLPKRPILGNSSSLSSQSGSSQTTTEEQDIDGHSTSDHDNGLHPGPFGDHNYATAQSPIYGTFNDSSSFVSADSAAEEDDERQLVPKPDRSPSPSLRQTVLSRSALPSVAPRPETRKAPPPPPPPRRAGTVSKGSSPVLSDVRPTVFRSHSTSEVLKQSGASASPFEEIERSHHGSSSAEGCTDFRQNPFKPHGMCSNCFEYHN
jgi:hypothetical protein